MEPIIGEIRPFAFNYPPQGWLYCDGRKLSIQQYTALYATIGFQYGGDQKTYFNLPNLQACVPNGTGQLFYPSGAGGAVYPIT
ncbi:MAG: tail fiber protein, partial [Mucilaginibacter sp.]